MADIPTPTPPAPISGYRSRAINAAVDYTTAARPIAGEGVTIADGVGGKTISVEPRGLAQRAAAWQVRAYPEPTSGTAVDWKLRVYEGLVFARGARLSPAVSSGGYDESTQIEWWEAPPFESALNDFLCVCNVGGGQWELEWKSDSIGTAEGAEYRAIAQMVDDGPPPRLRQFEAGVIDLSSDGGQLMPFDIYNGGDTYKVFIGATALTEGATPVVCVDNDTAAVCVDTIDPDTLSISLPADATAAFFFVGFNKSTGVYQWGITSTPPTNVQAYRYVAIWQIGSINAGKINQYWHGRIRISDMGLDWHSIDRGNYHNDGLLQLHEFVNGGTHSADWDAVDFLFRHDEADYDTDPGATPEYYLRYMDGTELKGMVRTLAETVVQELLDPTSTLGAELLTLLRGYFQPLVTSDTTTDGTTSGTYLGIEKDANDKYWQPH